MNCSERKGFDAQLSQLGRDSDGYRIYASMQDLRI